MSTIDCCNYGAEAHIADQVPSDFDIRNAELERARHALAYLKRKLGNDATRALLEVDLAETTAQVHEWVKASKGAWQTGFVGLSVPGPSAEAFVTWYESEMANGREAELRAGHPEHFISHPRWDGIEVVENIGETELPWRVLYRSLPDDYGESPMRWDCAYSARIGMEVMMDGIRVAFSMHQLRDKNDGLRLKLTTFLPAAVPKHLVQRHLHHFAIEFRNWTSAARLAGRTKVAEAV